MRRMNVSNVTIIHDNFFDSIDEYLKDDSVMLLVTNPPYISEKEYQTLSRDVHYEPKIALVAEDDGLAIILRALQFCKDHDMVFISEIGCQQRSAIDLYFPNDCLQFSTDLSGHDRFVVYVPPHLRPCLI